MVLHRIPRRRGTRLEIPDAHHQQARSILENAVPAMSRTLTPLTSDDCVLPAPTSHMEDSHAGEGLTDSSLSLSSRRSSGRRPPSHQRPDRRVWRHTIGIILLLATVVLWTASNFLASVRSLVDGSHRCPIHTKILTCRLFSRTIATPNHTLSPTSTHLSSLSCCY